MQRHILSIASLLFFSLALSAQSQIVTLSGFSFTPADITISAGTTVEWINPSGSVSHNVNGSTTTFPSNPESFSNGAAATSWLFNHTFTIPGSYQYQCDPHAGLGMTGTITVMSGGMATGDELVISGVLDGPLSMGLPKFVELKATEDISDLSQWGIGSANNGQGTDGLEVQLPAISLNSGSCFYVASDSAGFNDFMGFFPDLVDGAANINGDDAIELFFNDSTNVVDIFGDINVDGSGEPWEYMDGWAYRNDGTGPDGSTFVLGNWSFSGINALDGESSNSTATTPFPTCSYSDVPPMFVTANDDFFTTSQNTPILIDVSANDIIPGGTFVDLNLNQPANGTIAFGPLYGEYVYTPDMDFCGGVDSFDYEICGNMIGSGCDTARVYITVTCPPSYPQYDIATVTTVDATGLVDSVDVTCELKGIVHGVDLQVNNDVQFTIIDATGGIGLYSPVNFGYTVQEGDEVIVRGIIEDFFCLTQIVPDTIILVSGSNTLSTPALVSGAMTEGDESELIRINNLTLVNPGDWNTGGAAFNIDVTDGTNTYTMRIDDAVDINTGMMAAPVGAFDAIGIGGQFSTNDCNTGYQFLPRYMPDIIQIVNVHNTALENVDVYPNPVANWIVIKGDRVVDSYRILDVIGRQVVPSTALATDNATLSVGQLAPGTYFLMLQTAEGQGVHRFVKK